MTHDTADAVADPYAPPSAALLVPEVAEPAQRYYVVSPAKFWTLEMVTVGLYGLVWMYKHWAAIKRATRGDEWPVMRAIFEIFFVHSLTAEIDQTLRRAGIDHRWSPSGTATGAVLGMIVGRVIDRLPATVIPDTIALGVGVVVVALVGVFKWRIQVAANLACGDEGGRGNARFTIANIAWVVLFGVFWLLVVVATLMPA